MNIMLEVKHKSLVTFREAARKVRLNRLATD